MPRPEAFEPMLGKSFVRDQAKVVLTVGKETFDKYTLVQDLNCCGSYRAARLLTQALERLGVETDREAARVDVEMLAKLKGVGVTTLYVFLCWHAKRGQSAPKKWYGERPGFSAVQRKARKTKKVS